MIEEINYGLVRVATAVPPVHGVDTIANAEAAATMAEEAEVAGVQVLVFPELNISSYTAGDLFLQPYFLRQCIRGLEVFLDQTVAVATICIIGMPLKIDNKIFNVAVVCKEGTILGIVPKGKLANGKHFYEDRWFNEGRMVRSSTITLLSQVVPVGMDILFDLYVDQGQQAAEEVYATFGIEICEDGWLTVQPSGHQAAAGSDICFNLSASNSEIGKADYRRRMIGQRSGDQLGAYVYAASGIDESTGDVVFDGHCIIAHGGHVVAESERFEEPGYLTIADVDVARTQRERLITGSFAQCTDDAPEYRRILVETHELDISVDAERHFYIDPHPFVPSNPATLDRRCEDVFNHQVIGLRRRLKAVRPERVVIGVSGGRDSTAALMATVRLYDRMGWDRKEILGITMPGPGTTPGTRTDADDLMEALGISTRVIPIEERVATHLREMGHEPCWKCLLCENAQARERTKILMDHGFVIGTGDLSELWLGWCTYNGDVQSMYNPNCGIPKTLISHVIKWVADRDLIPEATAVLYSILEKEISPELVKPDGDEIEQKTEDQIGPYELHDFFLWCLLRHGFSPEKTALMAEIAFSGWHDTAGVYDRATILKWLRVFYDRGGKNQYKRENVPSGPKIGSAALSPRGDLRLPPDVLFTPWVRDVERMVRTLAA